MYKWPEEFGGYRANVTLNQNGTIVRGTVQLVPRKETTVDLPGADPALQEWVSERLWMQGMHLAYSPFEDGDGRYILSFDPEEDAGLAHPRGRRVLLDRRTTRVLVPHQEPAIYANRAHHPHDRTAGEYDRTVRLRTGWPASVQSLRDDLLFAGWSVGDRDGKLCQRICGGGWNLDPGRPACVIRRERRSQHTDDYLIEP